MSFADYIRASYWRLYWKCFGVLAVLGVVLVAGVAAYLTYNSPRYAMQIAGVLTVVSIALLCGLALASAIYAVPLGYIRWQREYGEKKAEGDGDRPA